LNVVKIIRDNIFEERLLPHSCHISNSQTIFRFIFQQKEHQCIIRVMRCYLHCNVLQFTEPENWLPQSRPQPRWLLSLGKLCSRKHTVKRYKIFIIWRACY